MAVASDIASLAALRSDFACFKSSFDCANFASDASISELTAGIFSSAEEILAERSLFPFLQ